MNLVMQCRRALTWCSVAAVVLTLGRVMIPAPATAQYADPIADLREALQVPYRDLADPATVPQRRQALQRVIDRLTTVGDLRRALSLTGWRDEPTVLRTLPFQPEKKPSSEGAQRVLDQIKTVDQQARTEVGKRLENRLRAEASRGGVANRLAVAQLLGDMGTSVRDTDPQNLGGYARRFTSLLAQLTLDKSPAVREAAAKALGRINPEENVAGPAFKNLMQTGEASDRRAAADGLLNMVGEITKLSGRGRTQTGVEAEPIEVIKVTAAAAPVAGLGVEDEDTRVRRLSLAALEAVGVALSNLIPQPEDPKDLPPRTGPLTAAQTAQVKELEKEYRRWEGVLAPLVTAFAAQGERLAGALTDPDPEVRLLARHALEWMGNARLRLQRRWESLPAGERRSTTTTSARAGTGGKVGAIVLVAFQNGKAGDAELLRRGVTPALKRFSERLRDPNPAIRRAAVDFLEMLENAAAPAVPALTKALADPDLFVRWAAARTLGRIEPDIGAVAVPALACLLQDRDLDVRLTAAATLEAYGPVSLPAVPALVAAVKDGDADQRRAAMYALMSIGSAAAEEAVPAFTSVLTNEDPRVRKTAAEGLGHFGPAAESAVPALRRLLQDEDQDVRQAAADALLNITPVTK